MPDLPYRENIKRYECFMASTHLRGRFDHAGYGIPYALIVLFTIPVIALYGAFVNPPCTYSADPVIEERIENTAAPFVPSSDGRYRPLWSTTGLPDDVPLNRPQGCCLDPNLSRLYVADTDNDRIMMFSLEGHAIGRFLTSRQLKRPLDCAIGPDGLIYISQIGNHSIEVFDRKGEWQKSFPAGIDDKNLELAPGRMAFDRQGNLLVIDRGMGAVWVMTRQGKVLKRIFESEKEQGISLLTGLATAPDGRIFTAFAQGSRVISVLDQDGIPLFSFGRHGALYDDSFSFPSSIRVDGRGRIWVVDVFRHTIKVFDPDGIYLFSIGVYGEEPGNFVYPVDLDIDKEGRVYVLEKGKGRLQAFSILVK